MKAFKKITFTLLMSFTLAFNGWAGSGDFWTEQKDKDKDKKKGSERLVEKGKKKNDNRDDNRGGGKKDDGGKKGKKP